MDIRDDLRGSDDDVESVDDDEFDLIGEPARAYRIEDGDSDTGLHGISARERPGTKRKSKFTVSKDFQIEEPSSLEMTNIVIEYLVIEGYPESAKALAAEAKINLGDSDWADIERRVAIKRDILSGDIGPAIEKLELLCPGILQKNTHVRFDLYLQQFLEKIRIDDICSALKWSSEKLSNEDLDDMQMAQLERACTLAAFTDPQECKYSDLLEQEHREVVAEVVNGAILLAQGKPTVSSVETMIKMKMYMSLNLPMPLDRGLAAEERAAHHLNAEICRPPSIVSIDID